MPIVVLALFAVLAALGFGWRSWEQRRRTGSTGFKGISGRMRNPIFTAMLVFGFGIALVTPNLVAIVGFVLLVATIELQVRVVEEPYLLTVHGDVYRDYLANVGRFIPGVGRANVG